MKSIVQEASSIAKAVELGWEKAQKPAQFSIKILELPEKNFFGFTTRSAKVALFFEEETKQSHRAPREPREARESREQRERPERREAQPRRETEKRIHEQRPVEAPHESGAEEKRSVKRHDPLWNDAMILLLEKWLKDSLRTLNAQDILFQIEPQQFRLKITLSRPILSQPERERQLLASFSALMLETLRKECKTGFRGHKIVITHA